MGAGGRAPGRVLEEAVCVWEEEKGAQRCEGSSWSCPQPLGLQGDGGRVVSSCGRPMSSP